MINPSKNLKKERNRWRILEVRAYDHHIKLTSLARNTLRLYVSKGSLFSVARL